jgi:hypothetical protein
MELHQLEALVLDHDRAARLLARLKVGVEILVASYGNAIVEEVPPFGECTRFLIVIRPGPAEGVGVGVGVGVAVGVGLGVGVGDGPPIIHEYKRRFGDVVSTLVRMPFVVEFIKAWLTVVEFAEGFAAR